MCREELDAGVLAIDAKFLDSIKPKESKQSRESVGKAWSGFVAMVKGE